MNRAGAPDTGKLHSRCNVPVESVLKRNYLRRYGYDMNFGENLRYLRTKAGKSRYQLWKITGLDQAFLSRLEKGEKNPSRNTVILLGLALVHGCNQITCEHIDELLLVAGYAPLRDSNLRVLPH